MTAIASQNQTYNLVNQIKPAQLYYFDFLSQKLKIKFTQKSKSFNYIYKVTAPNTPITRKEQDLLADLSNMIDRSPNGIIAISQQELSNMTNNQKWQNYVMRKNISHILYSKYKKGVKIDGIVKRKVIIFKYTKKGKEILQNPINNSVTKIKACGRPHVPIYKDKKNIINIRSNAHTHKSKFSNNSNFKKINKTSSSDSKKEDVVSTNTKIATVEQKQVKSFRPANVRKKATNAQRKARIYQLPPQFDKPKTLAEMEPITAKECAILQSKSGRDFMLNVQNQILQDMAKRLTRTFNSRWQFLCYFAKCLAGEKRDAVQCSGNNFYIKANVTEENILQNQQEKYLEETEQVSIKQPCPEHQFRAKLSNTLERSTAYNLLLAMQSTSEVGNTLLISLNKPIDLSENEKTIVLEQAQAVFNTSSLEEVGQAIESVEFVVSPTSWQKKASTSSPANTNAKQEIELPKGKWGMVCRDFISQQDNGEALYNHWLAPLSFVEKGDVIELSTSSDMVRDRIEQIYLSFLNKVAREFGITKVEFVL